MASKRRNMFQKNKTQETTEEVAGRLPAERKGPAMDKRVLLLLLLLFAASGTSISVFLDFPNLSVQDVACGIRDARQECSTASTEYSGMKPCRGQVIFEDQFDKLDLTKWTRSIRISGQDHEFVTYEDDERNSYVENGRLVIRPIVLNDDFVKTGRINLIRCTSDNILDCRKTAKFALILPPIKSAQLCTNKSFNFTYGQVTVRAKLPKGDWIIPEISLKPAREKYGPGYLSGKFTVASSFGSDMVKPTGQNMGSRMLTSGIFVATNEQPSNKVKARLVLSNATNPWYETFHEYSLRWTPDSISFDKDGKKETTRRVVFDASRGDSIYSVMGFQSGPNPWENGSPIAPFDTEFYICLGVSVGGHYGIPDGSIASGFEKPWKNFDTKALLKFWLAKDQWARSWSDESKLEVDYVKVTAV
ncbi:hypothetical protein AAG570_008003 [Ranatra chinensis]|uniref:GH16 domain-containing protein n=1 Tax=Ranatra chinensis TaxID=642074 RepID=A0ABD0XVG4_9HEMI